MSRRYESTVCLDTPGFEEDEYTVRGIVDLEMTGRGWEAILDGEPTVLVDDEWRAVDDLDLCRADRDRIEQALSDLALEDDSDDCAREEAAGWFL